MTGAVLHYPPRLSRSARQVARFRPRSHERGLDCWIAAPADRPIRGEPIVAVHGIRRQAAEQARLLGRRAVSCGRMVIAPLFTATEWPRYQQAVSRGRADRALLELLEELADEGLPTAGRWTLSGFSGGAQFAHRFALLHPERISRLVTVSAGWYTFPDDACFPYGLAPSANSATAAIPGNVEAFLRLPIDVCVGDRDRRRGLHLRRGPAIDHQQGRNRFERALRWTDALRASARSRGIDCRIRLHALPDCGHRFDDCVRRGGLDRIVTPGTIWRGQDAGHFQFGAAA